MLRDDRAVGRELRRHQHRRAASCATATTTCQRAQVVDERRGVGALQVRDPHGRLRSRRRSAPAPLDDPRAARHAGRERSSARCRCSATAAAAGTARRCTENVRVPAEYLLGEEGGGFAIAQARLGPGRIHHCMRAIGMAERALELMCDRAQTRVAFGEHLADNAVVREQIAESRIEIEQARLLVMKAAWLMDTVGTKGARFEISAIKVVAARLATTVIDRAIQLFGAAGVSDDWPLADMYTHAAHAALRRRPRRGPPHADRPARAARLRGVPRDHEGADEGRSASGSARWRGRRTARRSARSSRRWRSLRFDSLWCRSAPPVRPSTRWSRSRSPPGARRG